MGAAADTFLLHIKLGRVLCSAYILKTEHMFIVGFPQLLI